MRLFRWLLYVLLGLAGLWLAYQGFFAALAFVLTKYLLLTHFLAEKAPLYGQSLALGAEITLKLTLISSVAGMLLGLLAGIAKLSKNPLFRYPASLYIWLLRGTPLLVQILFAYNALPFVLEPLIRPLHVFGIPSAQDMLTAYWSAFLALSLNVGAYNAEVIRAGILAVPKGQWEAAQSLGLSASQVMRFVIMPQAIRIVVPPLVNNVVSLLKDSSLASTITLVELVLAGQRIVSNTFRPVDIYLAVAGTYLILTTILTIFTDWLERRAQLSGGR